MINVDYPNDEIKLLQMHPRDGVTIATKDGYYFNELGDKKQIIVVGPMRVTPADFEALWDEYEIESIETMTSFDNVNKLIVMRRFFLSIKLCKRELNSCLIEAA